VLRGAGPSFCSGGDLDEFGTAPDVSTAHLIRTSRSAGHRIDQLRDRITAEVHGACIGAGMELPGFAGRVIAAPDARFALPELAMGLIPGAGGTVSLPRRIGRWRTAWLALSGAQIDAGTALRWGLIDEIRNPLDVSADQAARS
jgi:enoyl-CoA hydratase/carnithine racemase